MVSRGTNTEGENFESLYQRAMLDRSRMHSHMVELQNSILQAEQNRLQVISCVLKYIHVHIFKIFHFLTNM